MHSNMDQRATSQGSQPGWTKRWARRILRGLLVGAGGLMLLFASFVVYVALLPEPPTFLRRRGAASSQEMMAQPPSSVYGSSVHVWLYRDADSRLTEVGLTGHADHSTCKNISGWLYNSYLEKYLEPEDMVVAGTSWFTHHGDPRRAAGLAITAQVVIAEHKQLREKLALTLREHEIEQNTPILAGKSDGEKSASSKSGEEIRRLQAELREIEQHPELREYLRHHQSEQALATFAEMSRYYARTTGLVNVHELPQRLAAAVRERVQAAARAGAPQVVEFTDLLHGLPAGEAVVHSPMRRIGDGSAVELRIDRADLTSKDYEEARERHGRDVEKAMAGDAQRRRAFYDAKIKEFEGQKAECAGYDARQRAQLATLNQECNPDGECRIIKDPKKMTWGAYCDVQLDSVLRIYRDWSRPVEQRLNKMEEERAKLKGLNMAILIESMLRDWPLSVSEDQRFYDRWRDQMRQDVWHQLYRRLGGINRRVLSRENLVFQVREEGNELVVRPVHIIDLARSVIVVNPMDGATQILDQWGDRRMGGEAAPPLPTVQMESWIAEVANAIRVGDNRRAGEALHQALLQDPTQAVRALEALWRGQFPDDSQRLSRTIEEAHPGMLASELRRAWDELLSRPSLKEEPLGFQRGLQAMLKLHPRAPPDMYLRLAWDLAREIAKREDSVEPSQPVDPYEVLKQYQSEHAVMKSEADPFRQGRRRVAEDLRADPAQVILDSMGAVQQDASYFAKVAAARGIPNERSAAWHALDMATERSYSSIVLAGIQLTRQMDLLRRRGSAGQAAFALLKPQLDLRAVQQHLDAAASLGVTGAVSELVFTQERLRSWVESGHTLDTMALHEMAGDAYGHAERWLRRLRAMLEDREGLLVGWRDQRFTRARIYYEQGDYGTALDALFDSVTIVALYHPEERWSVVDATQSGALAQTQMELTSDGIRCFATTARGPLEVLRISGLPRADRDALNLQLAQVLRLAREDPTLWGQPLAERILLARVFVRPDTKRLSQLLSSGQKNDPLRLLLLKAMVYGCAPPGVTFLPKSGRCIDDSGQRRRYDRVEGTSAVSALSWPELRQAAQALLNPDGVNHGR